MAKEGITPEDRLLQLIENPTKIRASFFGKKFGINSPGVKDIRNKFKLKKDILNLDSLSKSLMVLAAFLTLGLIWQVVVNRQDFAKRNWEELVVNRKNAEITSAPLLPLSDYLSEFGRSNMFSGVSEATAQATETKSQEDIAAKLKDLKLVGIIWSSNPQAMIESTAENKTTLLSVGDEINNIKVKNIYKDRVILGVDNQEWELR